MSPLSRGLRVGSWFGASLTLWTITPMTSRADCAGHYVTVRAQVTGADRLELLDLLGTVPRPDQEGTNEWPSPCRGALCSGSPATPVPSSPQVSSAESEHWAIAAPPVLLPVSRSFVYLAQDVILSPVDHSRSVFHPPRLRPFASLP
jgi:hypothetical protein